MAELTTSQEEKDTFSFLDWDEESIGKLVKQTAISLEDYEGNSSVSYFAACLVIISEMVESEHGYLELGLTNVTENGEDLGDWKIKVVKE